MVGAISARQPPSRSFTSPQPTATKGTTLVVWAVDVYKRQHLGVRAAAVILDAAQLAGLGIHHYDLAGLHIPQQRSAGGIQCAALAGKDIAAAGQGADAQGTVAPGVAHRNEPVSYTHLDVYKRQG